MSEQPGQGGVSAGAGGDGEARRTALRALWLGAGALVLAVFFFPVGLVLSIAALVVGVRASRLASRERSSAAPAVVGMVLGTLGLALSGLLLALAVVLWSEMSVYNKCINSANTETDKKSCRDQYFSDVEKKLDLPEGSMKRYGDML